jgi:hypothetical protein
VCAVHQVFMVRHNDKKICRCLCTFSCAASAEVLATVHVPIRAKEIPTDLLMMMVTGLLVVVVEVTDLLWSFESHC